mmetsp:Transcript_8969/g.6734  ORF Transcript_8969/g.6734 Transcript_8969/m.6734 type:complete len:169 (+) Transcript_8969:917-1423(+)
MLSYYRNNLAHLFINEAYISCVLLAFGEKGCQEDGVLIHRVRDLTAFLADLLEDEFFIRQDIRKEGEVERALTTMQARELVTREGDVLRVANLQGVKFMASLASPFVESVWVVFCFLAHAHQNFSLNRLSLAKKVQHLAEILYSEGHLINYDCCSLESIGNAVARIAR